jgi:hypothetical protein
MSASRAPLRKRSMSWSDAGMPELPSTVAMMASGKSRPMRSELGPITPTMDWPRMEAGHRKNHSGECTKRVDQPSAASLRNWSMPLRSHSSQRMVSAWGMRRPTKSPWLGSLPHQAAHGRWTVMAFTAGPDIQIPPWP